MHRVVVDNFFLIAFAVFAAASLVIIGSPLRKGLRASVAADLPGVILGLLAGVVFSALLAFANAVVAVAALVPTSREGFFAQYVLWPFLYVASLVSLVVLDGLAIRPLRPGKRAGAVGRGFVSGLAVVAVGAAAAWAVTAAARVAEQGAQAEETQAVEARSAGLSMVITVVDARLGKGTVNGRIVSHLTLDVTLRSTTEIQLRQAASGFHSHWINLAPPGTGFPVQPEGGLGLPMHIPAGSDVTYRLEVPIDEMRLEPADEFTTGTWTASLFLEGNGGVPGSPPMYKTETSFIVPDAP